MWPASGIVVERSSSGPEVSTCTPGVEAVARASGMTSAIHGGGPGASGAAVSGASVSSPCSAENGDCRTRDSAGDHNMMRRSSTSELPGSSPLSRVQSIRLGLRRYVHGLRTEGGTPRQEIAAIASGVFIGCLPFYGFHLLICWAVGWLFGLNRVKMYLAANISNPFVAPWLLFAELQTGSWLRSRDFHEVSIEHIRSAGIAVITLVLLLGSVAIGGVLAA